MKVVVALKSVPARDSVLRVAESGVWIEESDLSFETSEPDAYALEEALELKEEHGCEVVVLCVGSNGASKTIFAALAKGADRAIHIECDSQQLLDPLAVAGIMARALEAESPDLVLTGLQSDDLGSGQTGVILAELLGFPHVSIAIEIGVIDRKIRVKRELEDGWFRVVEMPMPALVTVQSGIERLRYPTLMGIKKARSKEVQRIRAADLGIRFEPGVRIERVYAPEHNRRGELVKGDPRQAAANLVEKLRTEARVL